jgi:hypothetical protein
MKETSDFVGCEVSCKLTKLLFDELPKKGFSHDVLSEGSGYPLEHFFNMNERISWSSFERLMEKVGEILTEDELVELGKKWGKSSAVKPYLVDVALLRGLLDLLYCLFCIWLSTSLQSARGR